jgi:hypothetical protein
LLVERKWKIYFLAIFFIFGQFCWPHPYIVVQQRLFREVVVHAAFFRPFALVKYSDHIIFKKKVGLSVDFVGESGIISHTK